MPAYELVRRKVEPKPKQQRSIQAGFTCDLLAKRCAMKKSRNRHSFILLFFVLIVSLLFTAVLTSARAGKAAPMAERVPS
jgi:hypothetical protein